MRAKPEPPFPAPRRILARALLAAAVLMAATAVCAQMAKRGLALSARAEHHDEIACLGRGLWYYGWSLTPSIVGEDALFVPMVRGEEDLQTMRQNPPVRPFDVLLLFNEPNMPKSASLSATPDQLAQYTAEMAPHAKFLVGPTPGRAFRPWFAQYMTTSEAKNDLGAIAIHWYGPPDFAIFRAYIQAAESAYHKPIWLTEFAVKDAQRTFTQADSVRFLDQALPFLDSDPMIQRYAWFGTGGQHGPTEIPSVFIGDDGRLSIVGQRYLLAPLSPAERTRRIAECHVALD